jgi:hypothetical protein
MPVDSGLAYDQARGAAMMPDPREVFLARAAARDRMVMSGTMSIDEAFDGLVPAFIAIVDDNCTCAREIMDRLERPLPRKRRAS